MAMRSHIGRICPNFTQYQDWNRTATAYGNTVTLICFNCWWLPLSQFRGLEQTAAITSQFLSEQICPNFTQYKGFLRNSHHMSCGNWAIFHQPQLPHLHVILRVLEKLQPHWSQLFQFPTISRITTKPKSQLQLKILIAIISQYQGSQ